jgi:hypothetical protein
MPLRVHFIHGLESSPRGDKARFFAEHFDAVTPSMDTSHFPGAVATQRAALHAAAEAGRSPDVLVGSSFGGAIAVTLLAEGVWRGPTLLLAPAAHRVGVPNLVPDGVVVTIVHGVDDDIIPLADSRALAATGAPGLVELIEVADGHRLGSLVTTGRLAALVREVHERGCASRQGA